MRGLVSWTKLRPDAAYFGPSNSAGCVWCVIEDKMHGERSLHVHVKQASAQISTNGSSRSMESEMIWYTISTAWSANRSPTLWCVWYRLPLLYCQVGIRLTYATYCPSHARVRVRSRYLCKQDHLKEFFIFLNARYDVHNNMVPHWMNWESSF